MFELITTTRIRRSVYFEATVAAGARGFTLYNQMLMPSAYGDAKTEYWNLIHGVAMWDVAAQRQVEIIGPDADQLAQLLTVRDLSSCRIGQGKYAPICNHHGTIINDPIVLKLAEDRYWFSIADSNILFWARAIAAERQLKVKVFEPDVSPLAVQGPKAEQVIAAIFGDWVTELKFFDFRQTEIDGIPLYLARSGWSKQGGFELYLTNGKRGTDLWNLVAAAGRDVDIAPGYPNAVERIESGLLSWGGDTDDATNPFEVRLGKYVDLDMDTAAIGLDALRRLYKNGILRQQLGIILAGDTPNPPHLVWYDILSGGKKVGDMTNGIWSYRVKSNIGFALISREFSPGDEVAIEKNGRLINATLTELPFKLTT